MQIEQRQCKAFHEAGHAVIGYLLGMPPVRLALIDDEDRAETEHDQRGVADQLPGNWLEKLMVYACLRVMKSVAGACTELRIGVPHEECGWSGDAATFDRFLQSICSVTAISRDRAWVVLTGMTELLLYNSCVWRSIEAVAERLDAAGEVDGNTAVVIIENIFRDCARPDQTATIKQLHEFVATPNLQRAAADPELRARFGA